MMLAHADNPRYSVRVRCGNLTAGESTKPRVISGAVWSKALTRSRLPSQGPAPLSAWGFFMAERFLTGATPVPESDSGKHEKRYCCVGAETPHKRPAKLAGVPRKAGG